MTHLEKPPAAPLVEQVAARLRAMATDGELTPGQRLPEARFADNLGVSRQPGGWKRCMPCACAHAAVRTDRSGLAQKPIGAGLAAPLAVRP